MKTKILNVHTLSILFLFVSQTSDPARFFLMIEQLQNRKPRQCGPGEREQLQNRNPLKGSFTVNASLSPTTTRERAGEREQLQNRKPPKGSFTINVRRTFRCLRLFTERKVRKKSATKKKMPSCWFQIPSPLPPLEKNVRSDINCG